MITRTQLPDGTLRLAPVPTTYPTTNEIVVAPSMLASIEADVEYAIDGWIRTACALDKLRGEYVRLQDKQLWLLTALSAAKQIIGAPEIEAVLTPEQYRAWDRIKAGPDAPRVQIFDGEGAIA